MGLKNLLKKFSKKQTEQSNSGDAAKERLHMVLMQDRASVSADYIDMMKQEIIDDIKKYIDVDEKEIDLRLTNQVRNDGSNGAPALFANIPITTLKNEKKNIDINQNNGNNKDDNDVIKNSILNIKNIKNQNTDLSKKSEDSSSTQKDNLKKKNNLLQTSSENINQKLENEETPKIEKKVTTTKKKSVKKVEEISNNPKEELKEKSTAKKTAIKTKAVSTTKKASEKEEEKNKVTKAKRTTKVTASKK